MQRITSPPPPAEALHAWGVAGFPLLTDYGPADRVRITSRQQFGDEGLLPAWLFAPMLFELDPEEPHLAARSAQLHWVDNPHVDAVIDSHLGVHGDRMASVVVRELVQLAVVEHKASNAWTVARFMIGGRQSRRATYFSVWDNGQIYPSADSITARFAQDKYRVITNTAASLPHFLPNMENDVLPSYVVSTVVSGFNGTISVISGPNKVNIGQKRGLIDFRAVPTEPIEGNLVVARMPHITEAQRQAIISTRIYRTR